MSRPEYRSIQEYPKKKPYKIPGRGRYLVRYDLAYDGGGSVWEKYYPTIFIAKVSIWLNMNVFSYGGSAKLLDTSKAKV